MAEENYKYLIKDKELSDMYLQKGTIASYSEDIGTAIHDKLPSHIPEKGDCETEVIRSDNPKFKEIMEKELYGDGNSNGLEKSIQNDEQRLKRKKKNRDLIKKYFKGTANSDE